MFYILNSLKKKNKLRKFMAAKRHVDIILKEFGEIYSKYNEEQMEESIKLRYASLKENKNEFPIKAVFNDGEKIVYEDGSWILVCDLETYKKNPDRFTWEENEKTKQGKFKDKFKIQKELKDKGFVPINEKSKKEEQSIPIHPGNIALVHPGKIALKFLNEQGFDSYYFDLNWNSAAYKLKVSEELLKSFIDGDTDIDYKLAYNLAKVCENTDVRFWFDLQNSYNEAIKAVSSE